MPMHRLLRKSIFTLLIVLLVSSILGNSFFVQASATNVTTTLNSLGTINYSTLKIGVITDSYNYQEFSAADIASNLNVSVSWWIPSSEPQYDSKMVAVHALAPDHKFLIYRNCLTIYNYWSAEWNLAKSSGWLLKDINGNYVTEAAWSENYMVDITNASYQQWLANTLATWLSDHPALSGVFLDNGLLFGSQAFDGAAGSRPINPKTGTYFTNQQILDGYVSMLNKIIDTIGTDKILDTNGVWNGAAWTDNTGYQYILSRVPRLNFLTSEGTFNQYDSQWYTVASWKSSVDFAVWTQQNFLSGHPNSLFNVGCITSTLPQGATLQQVMAYGLCSLLLAANNSQNLISYYGVDYSQDATALQFAQRIQHLDLVAPIGAYSQIASTQVFSRDFVAGRVLVNPSSTTYTTQLSSAYTTFDGQSVSNQITVPPHTGIILLK
jgi:hypothetical protein